MSAQTVFIKAKEYKVVNWIDGFVYVTTFSAAGKESTVKSAKTISVVMAALVEAAHAEALEMNAARRTVAISRRANESVKPKTIAAIVCEAENKNRIPNITAKGAFNAVLNREIHRVRNVDLFHLEMVFIDGSILTVLDQTEAKKEGISEFEHSFKSQDKLC